VTIDLASGAWRLITGFLPVAKASGVVQALRREHGITTAIQSTARGIGTAKHRIFGVWDEIAMISVTVPSEKADAIFAFIFEKGEIDRPKGGLLIQQVVDHQTAYVLPDLPAESDG
jgi:S1-C subfamily serine protease